MQALDNPSLPLVADSGEGPGGPAPAPPLPNLKVWIRHWPYSILAYSWKTLHKIIVKHARHVANI